MKKIIAILLNLSLFLTLTSCWYVDDGDPPLTQPFEQQYQAVTMLRTDFENSTVLEDSKPIEETGKIYVKDNYLFINQPNQGFHVFDNSNPSNPLNMAFLKVLGSSDIAIKNDALYINNATDLIAVTINPENNTLNLTKRIPNAFPELIAPDGFSYHNTAENEVIIDWTLN